MSKIAKQNRIQTYTEKRRPYKKYQKAPWKWIDIFTEIDLLKDTMEKQFIKIISKKYNIVYITLKQKYNKYKNNKNNENINNENRGGTNKIFTKNEEQQIFNHLKENFIDKNKMLCNEIIKLYSIEECKKLYPLVIFKGSDGWINMFKKRWNLSTVKCTISRIATKIYTTDEINLFLNTCTKMVKKVGKRFFSI
jgi:hypothetical protein